MQTQRHSHHRQCHQHRHHLMLSPDTSSSPCTIHHRAKHPSSSITMRVVINPLSSSLYALFHQGSVSHQARYPPLCTSYPSLSTHTTMTIVITSHRHHQSLSSSVIVIIRHRHHRPSSSHTTMHIVITDHRHHRSSSSSVIVTIHHHAHLSLIHI